MVNGGSIRFISGRSFLITLMNSCLQNMDYMDVDQIYQVPDTPDQNITAQNCIKRGKFVASSRTQRYLLRSSKDPILSEKSDCHNSSSFSSKNALSLQRTENGKGVCIEEFKKPSLRSPRSPSNAASAFEEKDKDCLVVGPQPKVEKISLRRSVRRACISPLNVAKLKKSTEKLNVMSTDKSTEKPVSVAVAPRSKLAGIEIRDFVSEPTDSHRVRGKTVTSQILSSKKTDEISSSVGEDAGVSRDTRSCGKDTNRSPSVSAVPPLMHDVQPANTRSKRQKQGPTTTTNGESSTSNSDNPEFVCPGSSSIFRSTGVTRVDPIIEIPQFSPQPRNISHDPEIRARQLEMLAMNCQELLFNDMLSLIASDDEIDADIAIQPHPVPNNIISNLWREARSQNPTVWRDTRHVPTSARTPRSSPRFPGQPRNLSSIASRRRGRRSNSSFPSMDVFRDMNTNTLDAFNEAFHQHDFNELCIHNQALFYILGVDYEMILDLDENNHGHSDAIIDNINALPESKVQNESHQETCAICLDTPEIGDNIRHLPCFHKFHKDCIDPWLKRKTLCPVCKSSIT